MKAAGTTYIVAIFAMINSTGVVGTRLWQAGLWGRAALTWGSLGAGGFVCGVDICGSL